VGLRVFLAIVGGRRINMPRVLLGDKFYPLVAVLVLAMIIFDSMLIWSLF
jgi:hypothetical protein